MQALRELVSFGDGQEPRGVRVAFIAGRRSDRTSSKGISLREGDPERSRCKSDAYKVCPRRIRITLTDGLA